MTGSDPGWLPGYHVTAERNWLNDPNGPIHHDGTYHLFFQENPDTRTWGIPRWAHVTSTDLVRWRRQPPAVEPREDGADRDGCWSGCARIIDGVPSIYYTGVVGRTDADRVESVCRAVGSSDLRSWRKDPEPMIPAPPPELRSGYHRDPFLWHDAHGWHMLLGSGTLRGERYGTIVINLRPTRCGGVTAGSGSALPDTWTGSTWASTGNARSCCGSTAVTSPW